MKLVLDTNVLFSAFATRGLANSIFELCLDRHIIIISEHILRELQRNLHKKLKMPEDKVQMVIDYLREVCTISRHTILEDNICRDKEDDKILGLSDESKADFIITGDKDLLVLKEFNSVPIITPREFWSLQKTDPDV
ncbi:MAG TPA: putative toxin-antitoxin system toxin component, PIN family [Spirochaetes bacterium]|nr:putative toxin-antitoxin system toxin component, PIN family [Spirochaetota bacterium]